MLAGRKTITERKLICRACPTKQFFREARICLKELELIVDFTKVTTNQCPDKHWEKTTEK